MQASRFTEFMLFICTPAISGSKSCFLVHLKEWQIEQWFLFAFSPSLSKSSNSSAITMEGVASAGLKFWEPSFTFGGKNNDGCDTSANQYVRKYFISTL